MTQKKVLRLEWVAVMSCLAEVEVILTRTAYIAKDNSKNTHVMTVKVLELAFLFTVCSISSSSCVPRQRVTNN
jgi:hypothetical protein